MSSIGPASNCKVGAFRVFEVIGRGGMAVVYRAIDTRSGQEVALKVLAPDVVESPEALARFERETRAARQADHPNVVHVLDAGQDERFGPYLACEMVRGETLKSRLSRAPSGLPVEEARRLVAQIAAGLAHLHAKGILHRDIKPANILLTADERVKVADFGVARMTGDATVTRTGVAMGTPAYMSPEQVNGQPLDERADLYALGIVLFEALTGLPPFRADNTLAVMMQHVHRAPALVSTLRPEVPEALEAIVARCLQKSPDRRFPNAHALLAELEAARESARPASRIKRMGLKIRQLPEGARKAMAAGVLVFLGLLCGLWLALGTNDAGPSAGPVTGSGETASPRTPDGGSPTPLAVGSPDPPRAGHSPAVGSPTGRATTSNSPGRPGPKSSGGPDSLPATSATLAPTAAVHPPPSAVASQGVPSSPAAARGASPSGVPALAGREVRARDGATMILVPGGEFRMGSLQGPDEERPQHVVSLPPFYLDEVPVTVARFRRFVDEAGYRPEGNAWDLFESAVGPQAPAVNVTWNDACEYARWAGGRLPTEAEWEKAARGSQEYTWPWGNTWSATACNWGDYDPLTGTQGRQDGSERATAVGTVGTDRSPLGVADMAGNVSCWTSDYLVAYPGSTATNPYFGRTLRVIRGGSWNDRSPDDCRCARRRGLRPHEARPTVGFRLAR